MDPWQVLGIDAASTYEDASSAYRIRLQLRHPDRHQGSSQAILDQAARETRELNEAWDLVRVQLRSKQEAVSRTGTRHSRGAGDISVEERRLVSNEIGQGSKPLAREAKSDQDKLVAHQKDLEVARIQLQLNRAHLDRAISEGGSIRISRLREAIASSEQMVIAAEAALKREEAST